MVNCRDVILYPFIFRADLYALIAFNISSLAMLVCDFTMLAILNLPSRFLVCVNRVTNNNCLQVNKPDSTERNF